jgi:hypothetical protein
MTGFFHGIVQRTWEEHWVTGTVALRETLGKEDGRHRFILNSFRH